MSFQLQIAIPLFVTFAALAAIAVWRRYFRVETFVLGLAVLGLGIFMTVQHTSAVQAEKPVQEQSQLSIDMDEFSLALAEQYMLDEQYSSAMDVLDSLLQSNGTNPAVQLAAARCALLQENYPVAVQLYRQLSDVDEELDYAVELLASTSLTNDAAVSYLEDNGYDPSEFGLSAVENVKGHYDDAVELIRDKLHQNLDAFEEEFGSEVIDAVERAADLTAQFAQYLESDSDADLSGIRSALKKLDSSLKELPELLNNTHLRLARLKGYVLAGDYEQIAKTADRTTVAEELVVLSQLLVSGLIDEKDFSDSYVNMDSDRYKEVLEICRDNLKQAKDDLTDEAYEKYEEKVDGLKNQMKEPVLFTLRQDLLEQARDGAATMQSKCYMALAKIENEYGDEKQAEIYISDALGTAANSDDENYRIPMNQMTGIIQGSVETSEIMNVAQYVDAALDHSLPLDVKVSDITSAEPEEGGLNDQMTDSVTKSTATINIGVIDKSEFPVVKARVQIESNQWDTLDEIKEHLNVYDCGSEITEFTLERLEFQSSRIILLCDCSGSMSGSVESLKQVIRDFAANMEEGEEVCVVGFNSGIAFVEEFSGDKNEVAGFADSIYASGGTALFDSLIYAGTLHTQDINANNIIIAMTDGQDGSPAGEGDMYNKIGAMAAEKGLTVYTIGLGSVDADYLQLMAQCGNGSFLYASNEEDLNSFYDFIHGQLNNQYILTYTAKNQTRNERTLEISLDDELGSKKKTYYLQDPIYTNEGSESYNPYTVEDTEVAINGLSTKFLYKSSQDQTLQLKGTGFDSGDDVTIRLIGNVKYDLEVTFVDVNTYEITIPAAVATGVYDLEVSVSDSSVTLSDELTIAAAGSTKNFQYGAYSFTALNSYVNDSGDTVLSGNVIMNGWLRFKGDVTVSYDYYDSGKAWVTDQSGFYVSYSNDLSTGLAKFMGDMGIPISFNSLGTFAIYDDPYTPGQYKDFSVEDTDYSSLVNLLTFVCDDFSIAVYPDMLRVQGMNFTFKLPLQEQIMRGWKQCPDKALDFDSDCLIGASKITLIGTVEYENMGDDAEFTMISLPLKMTKLQVGIDTLNNDYSVLAGVGLATVGEDAGFEFKLAVDNGKFDAIGLQIQGTELRLMDAPVPVSLANFGFYLDGFSKYESDNTALENVLNSELSILFDVKVASLKAYAPKIAKLLDKEDAALAELSDATLKLRLKEFRIAFDAKMKLASILELGEVSVALGNFDYTNALIGMYNADERGLRVAVKLKALDWHSANLDLDLNGQVEACLGYPYSGLWFNGNADFDVGWWLLHYDVDVTGDAMIGAFTNSSGNFQFSVILRGENTKGEYAGFHAYVTSATGFDVYKY